MVVHHDDGTGGSDNCGGAEYLAGMDQNCVHRPNGDKLMSLDAPARIELSGAPEWRCPACDHRLPLVPPDAALHTCAICGNHELYKKKDFPHWLGMSILVVACAALFVQLTVHERGRLLESKRASATMLATLLAEQISAAIDFGDADDVRVRLASLRSNVAKYSKVAEERKARGHLLIAEKQMEFVADLEARVARLEALAKSKALAS